MSSKQSQKSCCFGKRFKPPVAKAPPDIKTVFNIFSDSGIMKAEKLQRFLIEYQGEEKAKATIEVVQAIIDDFKDRTVCPGKGLSLQAFFRYLFSDLNPPLSPYLEVDSDMTAPLSHYFIYTGYNSSLTEDQLSSDRDDIPLIKTLQRGVRGIELAMWPNSTNDNVDILPRRFTQRNFLRVYPHGKSVDSSNPLIGWMHGAQMVPFNMQEHGRACWLMHGMFRSNGGCGYVKKPDDLLKVGPNVFDPRARLQPKRTLKVKIFMGDGWYLDFRHTHYDIDLQPDFCTMVAIAGVPADAKTMKTPTSRSNWIPVWNKEFLFELTVPELAMLQVEVHAYNMCENDEFGGQTCLPVLAIRPGIRALSLFNRECVQYKSVKLLMEFHFV